VKEFKKLVWGNEGVLETREALGESCKDLLLSGEWERTYAGDMSEKDDDHVLDGILGGGGHEGNQGNTRL